MNESFEALVPEIESPVDPGTLRAKVVRVLMLPDPANPEQLHVVVWPDPFIVKEGQAICWRGDHPFTLRFIDETPMESGVELRAQHHDDAYVVCRRARRDAGRVEFYKYSVAVTDDHGQIHLLDPGGVVEPDPRRKTG